MPDTYSPNLQYVLMADGSHADTWGDVANANLGFDDAKVGNTTVISTTGGTKTLSATEERVALIQLSGTLASNEILVFSGRGGSWLIQNDLVTGAFNLQVRVGASVVLPFNGLSLVSCDGLP